MKPILAFLGLLLIVATILPLIPTDQRWIRVFDFPRAQLAVLILITAAVYLFFFEGRRASDVAMMTALVAALAWQGYRIFPYTPLASVQVQAATQPQTRSCVRLVVANVLMENRNADALIRILRAAEPDIVLLVETDDWWDQATGVLREVLPHSVHRPQRNHYGMVLYSKFPLTASEIKYLIDENVPSIHAELKLPSGSRVAFYGVHPVPPPLADTAQRDAELLIIGKMAKESKLPAIVAGDLNDVGWSVTTRLFQRISGLLDPRHGRGFFASYHAMNPLLRWPLDHVFHDPIFAVGELRLLDSFGSDHFPVLVELCRDPKAEEEHQVPTTDREHEIEANKKIRDGRAAESDPDDFPKPR